MAFEVATIKGLWPVIRRVPWLAAILCRRYFSKERLAGLVYVDLFPRHESARVDLGQAANFQLHVQIINLSPFMLELDRADFQFWIAGVKLEANILRKQDIPSGQSANLFLSGSPTEQQVKTISRMRKGNPVALEGNIEFNCTMRSFARRVQRLEGVQVVVVNEPPTPLQ